MKTTRGATKTPVCAKCGSHRTSRREREGFFQKAILFGLGFYPWECNACWKRFYSSDRGQRARSGGRSGPRRSENPVSGNPEGRSGEIQKAPGF